MSEEPTNEHIKLYDGIAAWYVETYYNDMSDGEWLDVFCAAISTGSTIADVGCGPGQYARYFRLKGFEVFSVDISSEMLRVGKALDPQLRPVLSDINQLPFEGGSLDGLLIAYTLEHVKSEEIDEIVLELSRCLKPSGVIALMVKCGTGRYRFESSVLPGTGGFVQLWEPRGLSSIFEKHGFSTLMIRKKPPVLREEFLHERGYVLLRKNG
ncbi:MAG: class I SAM-dependent methyltransferase [Coriobacteriia bacterium]|nr:class I SAM-dependent methyltransferase [Coriobacteriia bacterium]